LEIQADELISSSRQVIKVDRR